MIMENSEASAAEFSISVCRLGVRNLWQLCAILLLVLVGNSLGPDNNYCVVSPGQAKRQAHPH